MTLSKDFFFFSQGKSEYFLGITKGLETELQARERLHSAVVVKGGHRVRGEIASLVPGTNTLGV